MKKIIATKISKVSNSNITKEDIVNTMNSVIRGKDFADAVRMVIREEVPPMIKKIVIPIVDGKVNSLALICAENFTRLEKKMDAGFEGIAAQFRGVHSRMDAFALNTPKYEDHVRLTRRVEKLEKIEGIKYDTDADVERASAVAGD